MKKICFVTSCIYNSGGTERVSTLIANGLASQGYEVVFFNLISDGELKFPIHHNVTLYTLNLQPYSLRRHSLFVLLNLRKFVKKN